MSKLMEVWHEVVSQDEYAENMSEWFVQSEYLELQQLSSGSVDDSGDQDYEDMFIATCQFTGPDAPDNVVVHYFFKDREKEEIEAYFEGLSNIPTKILPLVEDMLKPLPDEYVKELISRGILKFGEANGTH